MLVDIVLPIFLIVIAGWLLAYFDLIPEKVAAVRLLACMSFTRPVPPSFS